jgi:hypothetical protein
MAKHLRDQVMLETTNPVFGFLASAFFQGTQKLSEFLL